MRSSREHTSHIRTKKQLLTTGGMGEYILDRRDLVQLAQLLSRVPPHKMEPLLDSLFTRRELVDVVRRLAISKLILEGHSYQDISEQTGASARTIVYVKESLAANGGVLQVILANLYNLSNIDSYIKRRLRKGK